jgi:hypothetical protein
MIKLAALLLMLSVVCQDSLVCRGASLAGARFQSRLIFGQEAGVIARGFFILRSSPSNFLDRFFTEDFICEEDRVLAVLGKVPSDPLWRFQSQSLGELATRVVEIGSENLNFLVGKQTFYGEPGA